MVLADDSVKETWEAFYADTYGARTRFLYMLARVATAFADEPGVIGYDLLNEPYGDEKTRIGPFYELAAPSLRAADPDAIIFVSPTMLTSGGRQTELAKPTFENVAYAPHYYDPGLFLFHGWSGAEPDEVFGFMSGTARSWGAAMFLGEFGAPPDADEQGAYLDTMYRHLDDVFASSAQWVYTPGWTPEKKDGWNTEDFSIVDDKGALRANFRPRPYARRIAGAPLSMKIKGDELTLEWQNDPSLGETEIFAPNGVPSGADCTRAGMILRCTASAGKVTLRVGQEEKSCGLTGAEALLIALVLSRRRSRGG
jgi:endoglycosylceramidase